MKSRKPLRRIPRKTRRKTRRTILKGGRVVYSRDKSTKKTITTLMKGSLLYRVSMLDDTRIRQSTSTGKEGKYFATYPALALGIFVESKGEKNILGVFRVIKDIPIESLSKYGPGSHLDKDIGMIDETRKPLGDSSGDFVKLRWRSDGEVFLTETEVNTNIERIARYSIKDWEGLKKHINEHNKYEDLVHLDRFKEFLTPMEGSVGAGAGASWPTDDLRIETDRIMKEEVTAATLLESVVGDKEIADSKDTIIKALGHMERAGITLKQKEVGGQVPSSYDDIRTLVKGATSPDELEIIAEDLIYEYLRHVVSGGGRRSTRRS